jgi:hypothetical protein
MKIYYYFFTTSSKIPISSNNMMTRIDVRKTVAANRTRPDKTIESNIQPATWYDARR